MNLGQGWRWEPELKSATPAPATGLVPNAADHRWEALVVGAAFVRLLGGVTGGLLGTLIPKPLRTLPTTRKTAAPGVAPGRSATRDFTRVTASACTFAAPFELHVRAPRTPVGHEIQDIGGSQVHRIRAIGIDGDDLDLIIGHMRHDQPA